MNSMSTIYVPAQTGKTRVFITLNRARADHDPVYASYAKLTGVSHSHGEVTAVEIPDPDRYDNYLEVDEISGQDSRYTASLVAKFPSSIRSLLQYLDRCKEPFDIHLQFGDCENPSDLTSFSKGEVLEHVRVTGYNTDDFGSLQGDEGAEIRETLEISFKNFYDYVRMAYFEKAASLITNEVLDIFIRESSSCFGDLCNTDLIFATTKAAGGSPGTPPDVVFSADQGATWYAHDVDTIETGSNADGIADVGDYIVVISNTDGSINYTEIAQFYYPAAAGFDPVFTKVTTGIVGAPKAIRSTGMKAFVVGESGYVYSTTSPSSGLTVLDAGIATSHDLQDVYVYDSTHVVAVGDHGSIVYTVDGESFSASPSSPVGVGITLNAVAMRKATEWMVGTSDGRLFVTYDSGTHWTQLYLPGTTPSAINDIEWQGDSIGYVAATVSSHGRLYRTINAGNIWMIEPASSVGSMPASDYFNAVAAPPIDANFVVVGGLEDDGSDGILIVGSDSSS